jgi:hypothetical protein
VPYKKKAGVDIEVLLRKAMWEGQGQQLTLYTSRLRGST